MVISAIQWTGLNSEDVLKFTHAEAAGVYRGDLNIHTLEGTMHATVNDWIIKGVKGEFYPCKPDVFAATYVAEPAP